MALAGREKSMSFFWFVLAGILVGSVLWITYDEVWGRRTWKEYAGKWTDMEVARLQQGIDEEEAKIDKGELKKIRLEREEVMHLLESDEYKQAQKELKVNENAYDDARTNLQFAKAASDEIFYLWKHAQNTGRPSENYKKQYEEKENSIKELSKIELEWEKKYKESQAKVDSFDKKLSDLEEREIKLYGKVTPFKRQLEAIQKRGAPIHQFIADDLGRAGPVVWGNVDRCTTCHIPTLIPGYEEGKNPFKTHPHLQQIFDAHPVESYGCVTCHGGQGRATQIKGEPLTEGDFPHGFEKHWVNPLLRGDFIESSCNKCHVQQFTLDLAPVYTQGKHIFLNYGCINCHKIQGLEWAPKIGPDLRKIKDKVYPEWMFAWIKQPTSYLPETRMPQPHWGDPDEMIQAMAYLLDKSEGFNWKYGEFPGGNSAQGEKVFNEVGCFACHAMGDKGGDVGPALDRVAEKTSGKWIYNWIQYPKNWSTHARMPSLRLSQEEARNLTAYLMTKGSKPAVDDKLRTALLDEKNIKEGFRVINNQGCYACHYIKGFENAARPSVELTEYGRKDVHELAFGDADIPETWEAWTKGKLIDPQVFLDERSSSVMPKPNINEEQVHALLVFLKGQRPEEIPLEFIAYDPEVEKGRRLVDWYSCQTCHVIEGKGGDVAEWIKQPNFLPPNLASTGARLQTQWMHNFIKDPATYPKIRPWLNIRMPTFGFTNQEADALVRYFKKIAGVDTLLEDKPLGHITPEYLSAGKLLIGNDNFACASCHILNNKYPAAGPDVWAIDLAYGHHRLRPEWINEWVRNPGELVPGIRMPGYYPEPGTGPKSILGGDDDAQVEAIVDYLIFLGNSGKVVQSKSPPKDAPKEEPKEETKTTEGEGPQAKIENR